MHNKKSQAGIIIAVVIGIIIIIIIAFFIGIGIKKGWYKEPPEEPAKIPTISIFAKVSDEKGNDITANYYLEGDSYRYKEGILEKTFNEFSGMPINKTYRFCYWTDKHYMECDIFDRGLSSIKITPPKQKNASYKNITMLGQFFENNVKGIIKVSSFDEILNGKTQTIRLNISAVNGTLKRLAICNSYTLGIIYATNPEAEIFCPEWLNYTYDDDKHQINLTNNKYWCREKDQFETCSQIINENRCIVSNVNAPDRLKKERVNCFYNGISLENNDYIATYEIKTMDFINQLDYIKFYIIDRELAKRESRYDFYDSGENGEDNGIPDYLFQLNYTGG